MIPYLDQDSIDALRRDHQQVRLLMGRFETMLRGFQQAAEDGGLPGSVAKTSNIIPARNTTTGAAGGPVDVVLLGLDQSGVLQDGDTVPCYSWVKTPSADPSLESGGELWIWVSRDEDGRYWFTGQDCSQPPISQTQGFLATNYSVPLGLSKVPGTEMTLPTFHGWYTYTIEAVADVSAVPGNQVWDLDFGLYNETDAAWIRSWSWAGAGSPLSNPTLSLTVTIEIDATIAGKTVAIYANRNSDTGAIILQAPNLTGHEITGPI